MVTEIYTKPGFRGFFNDTRGLIQFDVAKCPSNDEFDHLWTVVSTFVQMHPTPLVVHLRHAEEDDFDPPDQKGMMHIAHKLMTEFKKVDKNCRKIIIQPRVVDDKVEFASMLMGKLFSGLPLRISADEEEIERLLCKYCRTD